MTIPDFVVLLLNADSRLLENDGVQDNPWFHLEWESI